MGKLAALLKYTQAGSNERKKLLASNAFKKTVGDKTFVKLEQAEDIAETTLLQEEVLRKVVAGAEPAICFRNIIPIVKTDSFSLRVVKTTGGEYAEDLAEGGIIPVNTNELSKVDITINKIGTRPLITKEVIEDSLFDIVEIELEKAGRRMENKFNRDILYEILSGITTTDTDPATTGTFAVSDIATALKKVKTENFTPDVLIMHPQAEGLLLKDSNLVYVAYAGGDQTLRTGKIPTLLGLKPYTLSVTTGKTDYYWDDTDAATHYMSIVMDSKNMAYVGMRRDMTVEKYEDPIHDLEGISVTMRYGVKTIQPKAGNRILTTA